MISQRPWLVFSVVAVAVALATGFGYGYLHDTLDLSHFSLRLFIRVFGSLLIFGAVVAILWPSMLRDWARRPDGSDSRKSDKQRS